MNRTTTATCFAALCLSLAATIAAPAQTKDGAAAHAQHGQNQMSPASQAYMDAMTAMDDAMTAMEMTGRPGADFALMMIPHHQSAIDMAKAYLASDEKDPELTKLSEEIIAAQESEIAFLKDWLARKAK